MTSRIDIQSKYFDLIKHILKMELGTTLGIKVFVFGSRAKGNAWEFSDLDLAIQGEGKNSQLICNLHNRFEESPLPFEVDIIDLNNISEEFYEAIKNDLVEITLT